MKKLHLKNRSKEHNRKPWWSGEFVLMPVNEKGQLETDKWIALSVAPNGVFRGHIRWKIGGG